MIRITLVPFEDMLVGDKVYLPAKDTYGYIQQLNMEKQYGALISIIWDDCSETVFAQHDLLGRVQYVGTNPRMS